MSMEMTPSRPYLLRASFDWLLDNDMTPHLLVNATLPHVQVPQQFVHERADRSQHCPPGCDGI